MCDQPYEAQLADGHCMVGQGVTEYGDDVPAVYTIYCHQQTDTVIVSIRDSGGGLQYINHPDGETYLGSACESLEFSRPGGILSAGSPYYTSLQWPEGPFRGVGAGIEWYVGIHVRFDADAYYGESATARISARDPAANESPVQRDEITVRVASTTDPVGLELTLREELPSFPVFQALQPLRFSLAQTDAASTTLQVSHGDTITVSYCPRQCSQPYTDVATWYDLPATVTPTSLPTRPPPPDTPTPEVQPTGTTPQFLVLRPAAADVGYVQQISAQPDRPNQLGYPWILVGMWSRGKSIHYGMIQFDLSAIPTPSLVESARLDLVGRDTRFLKPGTWTVHILGPEIDAGWRSATFDQVRAASKLADVGGPLAATELAAGRLNSLRFGEAALAALRERLTTSQRLSLRVDGPASEENNLFGWYSGVDVYGRETEPVDPALGPALVLGLLPGPTATAEPASATPSATAPGSAGPTATDEVAPTSTPSPTDSPTPTVSASPSATSSPTATPTSSVTPSPSATPTASVTSSPSATPTASATPELAPPTPRPLPSALATSTRTVPADAPRGRLWLPLLLVPAARTR